MFCIAIKPLIFTSPHKHLNHHELRGLLHIYLYRHTKTVFWYQTAMRTVAFNMFQGHSNDFSKILTCYKSHLNVVFIFIFWRFPKIVWTAAEFHWLSGKIVPLKYLFFYMQGTVVEFYRYGKFFSLFLLNHIEELFPSRQLKLDLQSCFSRRFNWKLKANYEYTVSCYLHHVLERRDFIIYTNHTYLTYVLSLNSSKYPHHEIHCFFYKVAVSCLLFYTLETKDTVTDTLFSLHQETSFHYQNRLCCFSSGSKL